jgi:hypothetical protein
MPDYREVSETKRIYRRCARVIADNPLGASRVVQFREEDVHLYPDGARGVVPVSGILATPYTPDGIIPLVNPDTLEPTGEETTQGFLYVALFSAYLQAAMERDAQEKV